MVVETQAKRRQRPSLPIISLPEELIEEIIKGLPVRSLVRFSCTCKRWRSLIFCDSKFNKSHLHHAKTPSWKFQGILHAVTFDRAVDCDCNIVSLLPKETLPGYHPEVLGSCNGILFVRGWGISGLTNYAYGLWNPYTNSLTRVTNSLRRIDVQGIYGEMCGLSYDRANDDYKAVMVVVHYLGKQSPYVFSLRSNLWNKLSDLTFGIRYMSEYDRFGITPDNGICYWQIKVEIDSSSTIICFDPVVEKFKEVPLPDEWPSPKGQLFQIGLLDGCLSLIHVNSVWVMKEYGSWTKLHVLQFDYVQQMGEINTYKPLGYNSGKDQMVLIARVPRNLDWRFLIADLNKGVLRKPSDEQLTSIISCFNYVPYTESLLCPWVC